ncbi:DUF4174 domain-containing protein [Rhodovulum sp. DZ06]|uniref:DUF4174 domain-containing protein n=1 Tax=Rhodovulum sp. DZ06 TaxID=3425126 RepID=UPI003D350B6D
MSPRLRARAAAALVILAAPLGAAAQEEDPMAEYLWTARPVIVFADSDRDPRFVRQLQELEREAEALAERDVVILTDTAPEPRSERSALRRKYRPHGFNVLLIGKDGEIKLRRPVVITADDVTRMIDRMPMRQREMGRR